MQWGPGCGWGMEDTWNRFGISLPLPPATFKLKSVYQDWKSPDHQALAYPCIHNGWMDAAEREVAHPLWPVSIGPGDFSGKQAARIDVRGQSTAVSELWKHKEEWELCLRHCIPPPVQWETRRPDTVISSSFSPPQVLVRTHDSETRAEWLCSAL